MSGRVMAAIAATRNDNATDVYYIKTYGAEAPARLSRVRRLDAMQGYAGAAQ